MRHAELRVPWKLLSLLLAFEVCAIGGFATLGLNTDWLAGRPHFAVWREAVFAGFALLHIGASAAVLGVFLFRLWGWRWLGAFLGVFALTLATEYCGTRFGIPFGTYEYSDLLGYSIGGRVPAVIPISWFTMGFSSYALAAVTAPRALRLRPVIAAGFLTCWDLVIDPAMSHVTQYWSWSEGGVYYGTPLLNFLGWALTGGAIAVVLELLLPGKINAGHGAWVRSFYLVNFMLPLSMMITAQLWLGSAVAVTALGLVYLATSRLGMAERGEKHSPLQPNFAGKYGRREACPS
jgi:putative membrane protein